MKSPAPTGRPAVDELIVAPESRAEIVRGFLLMSPPAQEPHAALHLGLAYVLAAHLSEGYGGAIDMLTRTSEDSNFAPDASVYPLARDPVSGGRQLEELAFEIADSQPLHGAGEKARELVRRGVRRVFCLVVKHERLLEWSVATDGWSPLPDDAVIDDRCFARPLPVRVLTHAAGRDAAVVAALDARGEPALRAIEARGQARGEARGLVLGQADALLTVLRARGLIPEVALRARLRTATPADLARWIERAANASDLDDVFED